MATDSSNSDETTIDVTIPNLDSLTNIADSSSTLKENELRTRCVLEDFTQCSKSHLWKLMMSFYERKGPDSWSQGIVPHFITCNAFIGKSYAKVLHGYLHDCLKAQAKMPVNPNEPLYIIELGAGSGKFSYFMLKALEEMQSVCEFPFSKIIYVMTDFTEKNFQFWTDHPALKAYFDSGRLDAGIFDAVKDNTITLHRSGTVLSSGSLANPVCIVANYLFDTLYHDIFQVSEGVLKEGLVSTGSRFASEPDPLDPEIIGRLDNLYQYNPISPEYYTEEEGDEPALASILNWYLDHYSTNPQGASILLPIGAMRALRRLVSFSNGRALVLSGDKGNNNPDQFLGLVDPHIAVHGSFSLMVNYHAIGAWFTSKGGFALHNPQEEASLKVGCFVLNDVVFPSSSTSIGSDNENGSELFDILGDKLAQKDADRSKYFPHLCQVFDDVMDSFGPNDFFVLQKSIKEDINNPPLRTIISLLKLADWDPDVFFKFRDSILNQAPHCGSKLRNDLTRGIPRVWKNYYSMDADKDIAFEIGRYFYGVRDYANALQFYNESSSTVGKHHVTSHNQGLCYYSQGHLELALKHFTEALELNRDYEKARNWMDKVNRELMEKNVAEMTVNDILPRPPVSELEEVQSVPPTPPLPFGEPSPVPPEASLPSPQPNDL